MSRPRSTPRVAFLTPIGPDPEEARRAEELMSSVRSHDPETDFWLFIDESGIDPGAFTRGNPNTRVIPHPAPGHGSTGGLCAAVLAGLDWLFHHVAFDCILKADTDALVIAPFKTRLSAAMRADPEWGLIGSRGETSNRSSELYGQCSARKARLLAAAELARALRPEAFGVNETLEIETGLERIAITRQQYASFQLISPHVWRAVENGYASGDYIQGGIYGISRELVCRMDAAGALNSPLVWTTLRFGEDEMMSMYARAAGLELVDHSEHGQLFGVQYAGLPYPPPALLERNHAFIHSIKNDPEWPEGVIREYFAQWQGALVVGRHQDSE